MKKPSLTPKQAAFVAAKVAGMTHEAAAIHAGYSPNGARQAGCEMMKRTHIKSAVALGKRHAAKGDTPPGEPGAPRREEVKMPRDHYADPMHFLQDVVNHKQLSMTMRTRAAEQLMPYLHARVGEKGKKEQKNDDAKKVASGGKLSPSAAPGKVVNIRG
jgi:phage terminase small subunit